ncbi:hypothetical protein [Candidatus Tisiphia endosymbiont of Sialis lutaria]|uniref:hypothetical protein n=1 Tax=Candidatus Tisiphia endosymbiont of Sialis lutaria TaxID=2029164 RepID=UPI00312CA63A
MCLEILSFPELSATFWHNNTEVGKGIKSFMEEHQIDKGYLVCLEDTSRKIIWGNQQINILPIEEFLTKLWNHTIFKSYWGNIH